MRLEISSLMYKKYLHSSNVMPEYNPQADFEWIRSKSGLPWLNLCIDIPLDSIHAELKNIQHMMTSHRDDYADTVGWKSFCIHGKSFDATREDSFYNDDRTHLWTQEAQDLMPLTTAYFKQTWPATEYQRLRVMLLEPGGYIGVHKDSEIKQMNAVNIAITQPTHCEFVMEHHGPVPFRPGKAFWLDTSNRHTIFNHDSEARWHIIVHQKFNIDFQNLVVKSYKAMYNNNNENSHNHSS